MRRISQEPSDGILDEPAGWWDTFDVSEQIQWQLTEVLCLLGHVGVQIRTREGRPLRWMEKSVDSAFADIDRILRTLEGRAGL